MAQLIDRVFQVQPAQDGSDVSSLGEAGLPYIWIEIDEAWRLPWDRHPNPRAAHAIAAAVAARLRGR